ncbi:Tll0287-like domain-containing protein [Leptolyngbya iicbica]|uniref:DUF3365 domain-containing protein n=2 Tax=Cyanophyceae TaxID=3028117 RepID=A0A4Q7E754_9CYAN|nr:DUF3365 domain-containing protein [Leptolyngbya sp. LK]RZM78980.1 DUF3365 domain-containing protein [Leptolyngbya sp. LK]
MLHRLYLWSFAALLIVGGWLAAAPVVIAAPPPADLGRAVQEIENLDALRSGLASTLEGSDTMPTGETFKQVCKPVGMRAKQLSQENGWQVKQIATKYRNPAHAPDSDQARAALARFADNPDVMGFWDRETMDGQAGLRYYRRINVEASCLACHGAKGDRPDFVKAKYPDDKAFDFNVGDLRGMYAVFVPDEVKAAIETAVQ